MQDMRLIYTAVAVDSLTRATTDCYYVFALEPAGFVIVAADERVKPILGYSYTNNFVVEDMPDNILYWLDNYKKQIKAVIDNNFQPDQETRATWTRLKAGQNTTVRSVADNLESKLLLQSVLSDRFQRSLQSCLCRLRSHRHGTGHALLGMADSRIQQP